MKRKEKIARTRKNQFLKENKEIHVKINKENGMGMKDIAKDSE